MFNTKAAVTFGKGEAFSIEEVQLEPLKPGEILIKLAGSGICHTDLSAKEQHLPCKLPAVLGHEGSGIVEQVGSDVKRVKPGDHVVMTYHSCGECEPCLEAKPYACDEFFSLNIQGNSLDGSSKIKIGDQSLTTFFGQSSFAQHAIVSERNVVKVPKDVPIEILGPLGCGILTGAGAVFSKLQPKAGTSVAVFGCGAVGLSALMASKVAGCTEIIAIDIQDSRLELAKELGATTTINSLKEDVLEKIFSITKKGVHYSLETTGRAEILRQSVDCLRSLGTAAVIGAPPIGTEVSLDVKTIRQERTITGVIEGSSNPQTFIPMLIDLYKKGMFPFDKLNVYYSLEEINQACEDAKNGKAIKPVITY